MKLAIIGAGAIGGYLGGLLAAAGNEVTFVARGANLDAIRKNGMRVILEDGKVVTGRPALATSDIRATGAQDYILLTVKAHQVAAVAKDLGTMCDERTSIVTMQNGIPWWYFQKLGGEFEGTPVKSADPDGSIAACIDPNRIIGTVVYPAAELTEPGVVKVVEGKRFTLGELDGKTTPRIETLAATLVAAGFKAPVIEDIRSEIWLKIWGNLSFNPISALTHATLIDLIQYPLTRELCAEMMKEAESVARRLGVTFRVSIERRLAGAERVGAHKTSMLQDLEQGKALEIEALVGAVVELGRLTGIPTPHVDSVYALVSLLTKTVAGRPLALPS